METVTLTSKDKRLRAQELQDGVIQIHLSSKLTRFLGLNVTCYLVDDVLIDTGFAHIRDLVVAFLSGRNVRVICCTHNHEDHTGNCGILSEKLGCEVYLANPDKAWAEGVDRLRLYRRLWWGPPQQYRPSPPPKEIATSESTLVVIPTPGHSQTHVSFLDKARRLLFVGDLYVTDNITGTMRHENPYATIRSLRTLAELLPSKMLNGHGLVANDAVTRLRRKSDMIEAAATRIVELKNSGVSEREITKQIFPHMRAKDRLFPLFTGGEYSHTNFVRACVRCAGDFEK